ncbi:MAG: right-handed parallel beta-helix repeat-containing protein [Gammaproteobacteria bacterium]|nr:right-handed parallel beta-helix repeat-containing protein [Gammaproteobacteria bacterium]MDH5653704.1 right-handed parallel beta-helix repeat-containing protein [Gammaproteobacteria bacterium]
MDKENASTDHGGFIPRIIAFLRSLCYAQVLFVMVCLFIALHAGGAFAYEPPIGIPAPLFGIDQTAPADWLKSKSENRYYIDNSHPKASDFFNANGTPGRPRKTIPNMVFPAGSYVEIHGGPYKEQGIKLRFDCTAAKHCWFRGTPDAKPVFTGSMHIVNSRYVILEHLDFNGGIGGAMAISGNTGQHIAIRHSAIRNRFYVNHTSGISIQPLRGGNISDVVIYKNRFSELGNWKTAKDEDFHGVTPNLWARDATTSLSRVWILENEFSHLSGNGVQVIAGNWKNSYKYLHHIYIGKNIGYNNRQTAFWSKQASDVIISQNISYGGRRHGTQPGDGIGFQYGPDNIWIIFNKIYDCNYGIRQSSTNPTNDHKAYIVGNLIYNIHPEPGFTYTPAHPYRPGVAIALWHGNMTRYVVDNTIHDVHGGINSVLAGPVHVSGNIISAIDNRDYHMSMYNSAPMTKVDHMLFTESRGAARFRWRGIDKIGLQMLQTQAGVCSHCMVDDPGFIDPANGNFGLSAGSKARNAGVESTVYDEFYKRYGIDIRRDYNGLKRPQGKRFTLGAVE